ncbi:MAG: substrate-binding domain-containing protein [Gemmatimonadaceae bacterium]
MRRPPRAALALAAALAACAGSDRPGRAAAGEPGAGDSVLVVFNAGSLARPLRAALDTFASREGVRIQQENAGSLETARKLTELGKVPDLVALADYEIFPSLLMPRHVAWYAAFARNRMVLAYTPRSRHAGEITSETWPDVLLRPDVEWGHSSPALDPAGYRALLVMRLAETHFRRAGLADSLERAVPARNIRPKEVDLVALLQAGELDYAWEYESVARAADLRFVTLSPDIDLGAPELAAGYARASLRIPGRTPRDSIVVRGQPILYALSVPRQAPHGALGGRAAAWLLSAEGRRALRREKLDALEAPRLEGTGVPPAVAAAARGAAPATPR